MIEIKILCFGQLAEIMEKSEFSFNASADTEGLVKQLVQEFPELKNTEYALALNHKMLQENTQLSPGDTVALLPPFSGG